MSSANAAAKKRRAPASIEPPTPPPQQQQSGQNVSAGGLTLPQVIALIDKRLVSLETFVVESKSTNSAQKQVQFNVPLVQAPVQEPINMDEFNARFDELADEIANMKNIVLSLQSYTMDVNKVLMEERIQVANETLTGSQTFELSDNLSQSNLSQSNSMV